MLSSIRKKIARRYVVALCLIALLATVKAASTLMVFATLDRFGEAINVSGQQRMLSQKIALYTEKYVGSESGVRAAAALNLVRTIDQFEQSHARLIGTDPEAKFFNRLPPSVHRLYFEGPNPVDKLTTRYATAGRALLKVSIEEEGLVVQEIRNDSDTVLFHLNQVVSAIEEVLNNRLQFIETASQIMYILMLGLIILEAAFIFLPSHQSLREAEQHVGETIAAKDQANQQLTLALDNIADGIVVLDAEHRVEIYSRGFCELLDVDERWLATGRSWADYLRLRRHRGDIVDDEAALFDVAKSLGDGGSQMPMSFDVRLNTGVSLEAAARYLPCGRTVVTYTDVTQNRRSMEEIERLAWTDSLTELLNRNSFAQSIDRCVADAELREEKVTLLVLDLDHFKPINDTYGHAVGDAVLRQVAERIRGSIRACDTAFRLGGDEFAVLIQFSESIALIHSIVDRLIERVGTPIKLDGKVLGVGVSIGAATFPTDDTNPQELLRKADTALYEAKRAGRRCARAYDTEVDTRVRRLRHLEDELRDGLTRQELTLFFQGKRVVQTASLAGAECLLRWEHPERGLVSPGEFIPMVEKSDLVFPVGAWVLRQAWQTAHTWAGMGVDGLSMGVNVSSRQFFDSDFMRLLRDFARSNQSLTSSIDLEITEEMMIGDKDRAARIMEEIHDLGFKIAVDDFGTGYSNISYLNRLPIDSIKIDRSFVAQVGQCTGAESIIRAVIDLGKNLGLETVVEGVETELQHAFLVDAGCDVMQGFLFDRPEPRQAFEARNFPLAVAGLKSA